MSDLMYAVQYARELIILYKMGVHDACRAAAWEYCVDSDKVYRYITE